VNTPRLFLGATILFWGWQTGQWLVAVPLALALEGAHATTRRWDFSTSDYRHAADLCTVIVLAVGVVLFLVFGNPNAVKFWFQWLAIMLLPLALLQAYGAATDIDLSALVWGLRRVRSVRPTRFNVGFPYAAIWILGASAANSRGPFFYAGVVALAAWALWCIRPRRASLLAWPVLLGIVVSLGYAGHVGLNHLQGWLEANVPEWLVGTGERTDPYESRTDLGRIGEIKGSSAIVLRVHPEGGLKRPLLLHRASYDDYIGATWVARSPAFTVISRSDASSWRLQDSSDAGSRVVIDDNARRGNPVLSLPSGTSRIEGLSAVELKHNPLGAVQAELGPGPFRYIARYDPQTDEQAAPRDIDLRLPRAEVRVVDEVARALDLRSLAPAEAMTRISDHFLREFRYALYQPQRPTGRTALAHFLLGSHEGHCEYFATATVLLLRAAGVPARYATGFSVQEFSARENAYVVRQRHAHAWARAWVNGRWIDLDTTPPNWLTAEAAEDSAWTTLADLWSWLRYRWNRTTNEMDRTDGAILIAVVTLMLAVWFAWRLTHGRSGASRKHAAAAGPRFAYPGADSEFYGLESRLTGLGWARSTSEALSEWLERIAREEMPGFDADTARRALRLHYRYRFDPDGLPPGDRAELTRLAGRILAALDQATGAESGPRPRSSAK
jgi:transglutaminase-like putative cysteine protease